MGHAYKQRLFSTQSQFYLTFEPQMLLKDCIFIIYWYYLIATLFGFSVLRLCLHQRLFLSDGWDLFFMTIFIFIIINHIISLKQTRLVFFWHFLSVKSSDSECCLALIFTCSCIFPSLFNYVYRSRFPGFLTVDESENDLITCTI